MPDPEEMINAVEDWMPDFLTYAERPDHPDSRAMWERAADRVRLDYMNELESDGADAGDAADYYLLAEETIILLGAIAEWLVDRQGVRLDLPLEPIPAPHHLRQGDTE